MSDLHVWENYYTDTPLEQLPWNAGKADADLVRLVENGQIPVGQALDIGTGPGHDAVYLIHQGFNLIAIDFSPTAIKIARQNASRNGLFGFFTRCDIRRIMVEDGFIDFANDRGCFHVLSEQDRPTAVNEIHRVLRKKGLFLLKTFSDKEPSTAGPHHFSQAELENLFSAKFNILQTWEGVFDGPQKKPRSISMLMEKR